MLPGELGSVNVDMIEGWKGDLQSWQGTGIGQLWRRGVLRPGKNEGDTIRGL